MKTCIHCKQQVLSSHYCNIARKVISENDTGSFVVSAAISAATNSALIGGILGGDIVGGIVGDILNGGDLFD